MAKFCREILQKMQLLTKKLEEILGPDTGELNMRCGIHSGPVTAGVLRGERSRFQLFGDTMNTASRIESSGQGGRIHMSQDTANLIISAGKGHWVEKRLDKIVAKGKGELQTYWLAKAAGPGSTLTRDESNSDDSARVLDGASRVSANGGISSARSKRLVQWNVQRLGDLLKLIAVNRVNDGGNEDEISNGTKETEYTNGTRIPLDEVREVIDLPRRRDKRLEEETDGLKLEPEVKSQLNEYVTVIASMYEQHPFHCFEHASHVMMSTLKLMSRFRSAESAATTIQEGDDENLYRFTSDPLIQFACAFSALIHDVQHPGVPNTRLAVEEPDLAERYRGRSVAEQRSLDVAWDLLMEDQFSVLRNAIYQGRKEEERFRQLVVNCIMATDIMDKDLKALRSKRWDQTFGASNDAGDNDQKQISDRKATIVIEHLVQASDVAHTMQHWTVFRKWNQRLFDEMYTAYKEGRSDTDPSLTWYRGEIGFFDHYVIPLANRLKEFGEFLGVSGDEVLDFAKKNRAEWKDKGEKLVEEMKSKYDTKARKETARLTISSYHSTRGLYNTLNDSDKELY